MYSASDGSDPDRRRQRIEHKRGNGCSCPIALGVTPDFVEVPLFSRRVCGQELLGANPAVGAGVQ